MYIQVQLSHEVEWVNIRNMDKLEKGVHDMSAEHPSESSVGLRKEEKRKEKKKDV